VKLTIKQEAFCLAYVESGSASAAYRVAYNASKMKPATVNRTAKELLDTPKITARIKELQYNALERHNVTVDSLLLELEEARQVALSAETPQTSAAVGATMGKAKLMGLDKQLIDVTTNGEALNKPTVDTSKLTSEQLKAILAARINAVDE